MHGSIANRSGQIGLALVCSLVLLEAGVEVRSDEMASGQTGKPQLVAIAPGTIVRDQPPQGWNYLVVKSIPRLASGDLGTLPRSAFRTATLIRTVILADVGRSRDEPSTFLLRRVGVGLCVPVPSKGDVVVNSARLAESGARLTMMEKVVLQAAEAKLAQGRLVAQNPSFALYRGPSVLDVNGGHQDIILNYALMVDARRGSLRVLVWPLAEKGGAELSGHLSELKPDCIFDCPLNVKAERLLGAVPISWSFAMENLPPGRTVPVSPDLRRYFAKAATRQPLSLYALEQALRHALNERQPEVHQTSGGS